MSGLKKISSKKPIKRVPFDLLDDFSIYCHLLKLKDLTQEQIADILGKDRCTILYHLNRYTDKNQFSKPFKRKVENFNEKKFISEYKKTGNMNRFFKGINELPEKAIEILKRV